MGNMGTPTDLVRGDGIDHNKGGASKRNGCSLSHYPFTIVEKKTKNRVPFSSCIEKKLTAA